MTTTGDFITLLLPSQIQYYLSLYFLRLQVSQLGVKLIPQPIAEKVKESIKPLLKNIMTGADGDCVMNIDEAAAFLRVKESWIYNNAQKEDIPRYKASGLKFIKSDLIKWLRNRKKY